MPPLHWPWTFWQKKEWACSGAARSEWEENIIHWQCYRQLSCVPVVFVNLPSPPQRNLTLQCISACHRPTRGKHSLAASACCTWVVSFDDRGENLSWLPGGSSKIAGFIHSWIILTYMNCSLGVPHVPSFFIIFKADQLRIWISSTLLGRSQWWYHMISLDIIWLVFGTFFFPYIGNNHPNWLTFFRGVGIPPTTYILYHSTSPIGAPLLGVLFFLFLKWFLGNQCKRCLDVDKGFLKWGGTSKSILSDFLSILGTILPESSGWFGRSIAAILSGG